MAAERGWQRDFEDSISLPDSRMLGGRLHGRLTSKEADLPEWQAAIEALMLVVEFGGPTMFARIGAMQALNRGGVREFNPSRKEHHWGRRKLKRDRL